MVEPEFPQMHVINRWTKVSTTCFSVVKRPYVPFQAFHCRQKEIHQGTPWLLLSGNPTHNSVYITKVHFPAQESAFYRN